MTEVDLKKEKVGVREKLPDDCFEDYYVDEQDALPMEGPLFTEDYVNWGNGLAAVIVKYRKQTARCRDLNHRRGPATQNEGP